MKKIGIMIICMFFLSGCSISEINKGNSVKPDEVELPNKIPQQLKQVDKEKLDSAIPYMSKSYLDLLDSVFFAGENAEDYYRESHRVYQPGEEIVIDADSLPRDGRYEVSFMKFNQDEKTFETLLKETVNRNDDDLHIRIPDEENSAYYVREIALNTKNEILKREYQRIFVLFNEVNARIDLDRTYYSPGDTMKVTLKNLGTVELDTGYGVILEKLDGERWEPYPLNRDVPAILITLRTGQTFSQDVSLKGLEKGTYRIIHGMAGEQISVAFMIE